MKSSYLHHLFGSFLVVHNCPCSCYQLFDGEWRHVRMQLDTIITAFDHILAVGTLNYYTIVHTVSLWSGFDGKIVLGKSAQEWSTLHMRQVDTSLSVSTKWHTCTFVLQWNAHYPVHSAELTASIGQRAACNGAITAHQPSKHKSKSWQHCKWQHYVASTEWTVSIYAKPLRNPLFAWFTYLRYVPVKCSWKLCSHKASSWVDVWCSTRNWATLLWVDPCTLCDEDTKYLVGLVKHHFFI